MNLKRTGKKHSAIPKNDGSNINTSHNDSIVVTSHNEPTVLYFVLCLNTQSNISMYYRTQSAI